MRVLVVEDEHRIAGTIKKGLELERYAVDAVYTGTDGFDLATTEEYDVIILDLMLPGMDGLSLLRELRKVRVQTPVLILTAKGQITDKIAGLDGGADDYLAKPFAFEELLARIRALTRRAKTVTDPVLVVGDLRLDPVTFTVMRDGHLITLSRKEFSILEFLMRNTGTVLTKDQIIRHVWDYDADILPNTVEVNVKNLRKKIDLAFPDGRKLIQTVRGFGYKISSL